MRPPILEAQAHVDVPLEAAREWFLSLEEHPERYQFDTHEGFDFVEGSFGDEGARFRTRETFLFVTLSLSFELVEVRDKAFSFCLSRPAWVGVWGRFALEEDGCGNSTVSLQVGSETRLGQLLLRFYPVAATVQGQIRGEVQNIKRSMESVYGRKRASASGRSR